MADGLRCVVYGALAGRLTAERHARLCTLSRDGGLGENSFVFRIANASSVEKRNTAEVAEKALK